MTGRQFRRFAAATFTLATQLCHAEPASVVPLDESAYRLSRGMLELGDARFVAKPIPGREGCYSYQYVARPSGIVRLVIGEISEKSLFCVIDGRLRSEHFEFVRADRPKSNFSLDFDWIKGVVRTDRGELRRLDDNMVDRLTMQLVVRRWVIERGGQPGEAILPLTMVEDDRAPTYQFRIVARESVAVPAGNFEAVRVERVDSKKKSTRFWIAPARDWTAVRVEQVKEGDEQLRMVLTK
jgi:hypothetical protein